MTFCLYLSNDNTPLLPSEMQAEIKAGRSVGVMNIGGNGSAGSSAPDAAETMIMQMYTRLCKEHGEDVPEMVFEV